MLNAAAQDRHGRRLQMVLSWREKAAALASGERPPRDSDLPPGPEAAPSERYFQEQLNLAEKTLAGLRGEHRELCGQSADLARIATHQSSRLPDQVRSGALSARAANDENRRLQGELAGHGGTANFLNRLLRAENSGDVGGFIDLPLPRYAREYRRISELTGDREASGGNAPSPVPSPPSTGGGVLPRGRKRFASLGLWDLTALAVAVVVVAGGWLYYQQRLHSGGLQVELLPAGGGTWRLSVTNKGLVAAKVAVPHDSAGADSGKCHTAALEARGADGGGFRRIPGTAPAWKCLGLSPDPGRPLSVEPGLTANWLFDPSLLVLQEPAESLRITFTSPGGRVIIEEPLQISVKR